GGGHVLDPLDAGPVPRPREGHDQEAGERVEGERGAAVAGHLGSDAGHFNRPTISSTMSSTGRSVVSITTAWGASFKGFWSRPWSRASRSAMAAATSSYLRSVTSL